MRSFSVVLPFPVAVLAPPFSSRRRMPHPTPAATPMATPISPPRARLALGASAGGRAAALAQPAAAQQHPPRPACTTDTLQTAAGPICGTTDTTVVAGA